MRRPVFKGVVFWLTGPAKLKLVAIGLIAIALSWILFHELPTSKTWTTWTTPLAGQTIIIDAGHGGPDGGAVSPGGIIEKDISLSVALYLRDFLQQSGALVTMTRESDRDLSTDEGRRLSARKREDLRLRSELINQKDANMLISIHLNSFPIAKYSGAQTFFTDKHPINRTFAEIVQRELREQLANTNRVAKKVDTVYILNRSKIPSVLIEVGFLSNEREASMLASSKYQRSLADAIYRGVMRYHATAGMRRDK